MPEVIVFKEGGYRYIKAGFQFSSGVAAEAGFAIERARLARPLPLAAGFAAVEAHLAALGRPSTAFAACELRSGEPFTEQGFEDFNREYVKTFARRGGRWPHLASCPAARAGPRVRDGRARRGARNPALGGRPAGSMPGKVTPRDARAHLPPAFTEPRRAHRSGGGDAHRRWQAVAALCAARRCRAHERASAGAGPHRLEALAAHLLRSIRARGRRELPRVQLFALGRMGGLR